MSKDVYLSEGMLISDEGVVAVGDLTDLASSMLAYKTWNGSAYVWSGSGQPDTAAFTNILFAGPSDPASASGGRDVAGDIWVNTGA